MIVKCGKTVKTLAVEDLNFDKTRFLQMADSVSYL